MFGQDLAQELLNCSIALRFLSKVPRRGISHHEVAHSFGQHIDGNSFLLIGAVEAVFPGKVSDDAVALHNVEASCKKRVSGIKWNRLRTRLLVKGKLNIVKIKS